MAEQTLLAPGVAWRGTGFAARIGPQNPGKHSLKLGIPGLYDGRPLAFKTTMSVCNAPLSNCGGALSMRLAVALSFEVEKDDKESF